MHITTVRKRSKRDNSCVMTQFDSYIYTLNMKQGPEVSRHESELNTNCQTLVDRSFTTLYRSGRA